MEMASVTVRKKRKKAAENIRLIEQKERTRFWKNVQKQENGCWVWTGSKKTETGKCYFLRSVFAGVSVSKATGRCVKTPPHLYAMKLTGQLIEKAAEQTMGYNRRVANMYFLKTGKEISRSRNTCKTDACCNPDHFTFEIAENFSDKKKIELADEAKQQEIERIKRLREVGFRSIDVIEYDIQCVKAKANRINLNGEYFYHESLQTLYEEAIHELKERVGHANSLFRNSDAREEIYHKLYQAIIDGLEQFDSDCKEMEDRDAH